MPFIHPHSLSETLNALNDALFFHRPIPARDSSAAAAFIASRFDQPRAYAHTFALFPAEHSAGIHLFTGEHTRCAAARHIVGQESIRTLRLLQPKLPAAQSALASATASLRQCIGPPAPTNPKPNDGQIHWEWPYRGGIYCCGRCSVALWRNLLAGSFDSLETRLLRGLKALRAARLPNHQWRRFPFWYTLSALVDMPPLKPALDELRHAAPRAENFLAKHPTTPYSHRHAELARRLLALI